MAKEVGKESGALEQKSDTHLLEFYKSLTPEQRQIQDKISSLGGSQSRDKTVGELNPETDGLYTERGINGNKYDGPTEVEFGQGPESLKPYTPSKDVQSLMKKFDDSLTNKQKELFESYRTSELKSRSEDPVSKRYPELYKVVQSRPDIADGEKKLENAAKILDRMSMGEKSAVTRLIQSDPDFDAKGGVFTLENLALLNAEKEKKKKNELEKPAAGWKQNLREMLASFIDGLGLGNFGNFLMEFLHLDKPHASGENKPAKPSQAAAPAPVQPGKEEPAQSPKPTESQPAAGAKQEASQNANGYNLDGLDAELTAAAEPAVSQQKPYESGSVVLKTDNKLSSPEDYLCTVEETQMSPSSLFLDNLIDITQNSTPLLASDTGITLKMTNTLSELNR